MALATKPLRAEHDQFVAGFSCVAMHLKRKQGRDQFNRVHVADPMAGSTVTADPTARIETVHRMTMSASATLTHSDVQSGTFQDAYTIDPA